jgi:hypothetical protein
MPFLNFHSARVKEPDIFEWIKMLVELPNGIQIYGGTLKSNSEGSTHPQTYRFPKSKFTIEEAKNWLKTHSIEPISFEPAIKKDDSVEIRSVTHVDFLGSKIGGLTKTQEGYLKGTAPIAKVGILKYHLNDGSTINEFVPEDTLFNQESIDTLSLKPITDGHPLEKTLDSKNAKKNNIGSVGEKIGRVDDYLVPTIIITDGTAIESIHLGKQELSPGYTCELIIQKGEYNGQKYDAIQTNRKYNHLAICDKARGGKDLRLNIDSIDNIDGFENNFNFNFKKEVTMALFKIDGIDYEAAPQVVNYITKIDELVKSKSEELIKKISELDKITANLDAANEQISTFQKRDIGKEIAEGVNKRFGLFKIASIVLDEEEIKKFDSQSEKEVKIQVIKKRFPTIDLDKKSDAYIDARFDAIIENTSSDTSTFADQIKKGNLSKGDSKTIDVVEKARADSEKAMKENYKTLGGFAK